jgi:hypothetical protein
MKKPPKKDSKKQQVIVLVDGDDNYYEFPRAVLEKAKVSERRKEKVKAALDDVLGESGYINAPVIPGAIVSQRKGFRTSRALSYAGFYLKKSKS